MRLEFVDGVRLQQLLESEGVLAALQGSISVGALEPRKGTYVCEVEETVFVAGKGKRSASAFRKEDGQIARDEGRPDGAF